MAYSRKDVEKTKMNAKKFVRYQEGAEKYSMGLTKFTELAKEAKAVYKIDKVTLVNCEIFERYLETSIACCIQHFSWHFVMTSSAKILPMAYWQR